MEEQSRDFRLPNSNPHEELEIISRTKLNSIFPAYLFELRDELQRDKGVDITGELKSNGFYTNYRFILQVKASAVLKPNRDGSYSYALDVANINYLMNAGIPAFYVLYNATTDIFHYKSVMEIYRDLEKHHKNKNPKSFSPRFRQQLDMDAIELLYNQVWEWGNSLSKFHREKESSSEKIARALGIEKPIGTDSHLDLYGSLFNYLAQVSDYEDSWNAFYRPAELIGREVELKKLMDFAQPNKKFVDSKKNVLWQIIYGDNAVGKTRLSIEWLQKLASMKWATGKLDASFHELEDLVIYSPVRPTAIVFDNADLVSDRVWLLLEKLEHKWNKSDIPIRMLFISHSNAEPRLGYYDRSQKIINSRFGDGLQITPILTEQDCRKIMSQTALRSGVDFDDTHFSELFALTGGRPAFLSLAGVHKFEWRNTLSNYAKNLLRKGEILFGQQGLDLVVLSALIGPVTDDIRHNIAPDTSNLSKLTELFSKPLTVVSEFIPRIQPDLLANEVIYEAFTSCYTKVQREILTANIFRQNPEISLSRVTDLWRESLQNLRQFNLPLALSMLYTEAPSELTGRVAVLESLFLNISKHFRNSRLQSKFNTLFKLRSSTFAASFLAATKITDKNCDFLLSNALHSSMPSTGLGRILLEFQKYIPCTFENRVVWALLLDLSIGQNDLKLDAFEMDKELAGTLTTMNPKELYVHIERYLFDGKPLERVYCAIKLSDWASRLRIQFEEGVENPHEVVERLFQLMESLQIPDFISAGYSLINIINGPLNQRSPERLNSLSFVQIFKFLHSFDYNSEAFLTYMRLIGSYASTFYKFTCIFNWFDKPEKKQGTEVVNISHQIVSLQSELQAILTKGALTNESASTVALCLLKTGWWDESLEDPLINLLLDYSFGSDTKYEVLVRSFINDRKQELKFFRRLVEFDFGDLDSKFKYIILAGIYCSGLFERQNIIDMKLPSRIGKIDVFRLKDESHKNLSEGRLGTEAAELLQILRDIHVGLVGFTIHKLKAKDTTGNWAYYFVLVEPENETAFLRTIQGNGEINLLDFGYVVASSYGEKPTDAVKEYLKDKYDFDV